MNVSICSPGQPHHWPLWILGSMAPNTGNGGLKVSEEGQEFKVIPAYVRPPRKGKREGEEKKIMVCLLLSLRW